MDNFDLKKYLAENQLNDPLTPEDRKEMNRLYAIDDDLQDQLSAIHKQISNNQIQKKKIYGGIIPMSDRDKFYKPDTYQW